MKRFIRNLAIFVGACPVLAHAQYSYFWYHPANWGAPHYTADTILGSFESVNLPNGVLVSVDSPTGAYGPTAVLPRVFNTTFDGTVFSMGRYDGSCALLNTSSNSSDDVWDPSMVGDLTFTFTTAVERVGFSLGNMAPGAHLKINGSDQGEFLPKFSSLLTGEYQRDGYFEIFGPNIHSITLDVLEGDSIVVDHLTFIPSAAPVPEPASLSVIGLGALAMLRRRRRLSS